MGSFSRLISISQARLARSAGWSRRRRCAYKAFNSAVVKLPEDPRPVPAGMSASVAISICGVRTPTIFSASRMIGWCTSSTCDTCSSCEYLRKTPGTNGRIAVTYTYLSIAAEMTDSAVLPVVGREVGAAAPEGNPERAARDDHVNRTVESGAA